MGIQEQDVTVTVEEVNALFIEVSLFVLVSNLQWSVWGIVQGKNSLAKLVWCGTEENWYHGYTRTRLNWYLALKDEIFGLVADLKY
jgi:hypothetical protein